MSCPSGYNKVDIAIPPYYICVPISTRTTPTLTTPVKPVNCYTVYAPVLAVYNKQLPLIYQVMAFTFDIYTELLTIPSVVVTHKKRPTVPAEVTSTASSVLDIIGGLLVDSTKKNFGDVPVGVRKITTVFEPICSTSYVLVRSIGTPTVRVVIKPDAISGSDAQLAEYLSAGVYGNVHRPTKATTYQIVEVAVQFVTSPSQLTALIHTLVGR